MRPAHGFALQAIGPDGATATQACRRLGISKQAAGKTIERLEELGYVRRAGDETDRRRKLVRITPRGQEALGLSAMIFDDIRARLAARLTPAAWPRWKPTCGPWCPATRSASTYRAGSGPERP